MQDTNDKEDKIKVRATVPIYYSSTTNTSKKMAYAFANKLDDHQFISSIINIGDFDKEEFLESQGPVIFILSTYGNGGSPSDGEEFRAWITELKGNNLLQKMHFCILALGNRNFQHFCGNGRAIQESLLVLGASQIFDITLCDSSSTDNTVEHKFPEWSDSLISKMKEKYELKEMSPSTISKAVSIQIINEENENWEQSLQESKKNFSQEITNYIKIPKAEVIHIKQIRENEKDERSTLWIRVAIPEGTKLSPATNISVYPLNNLKEEVPKGSLLISKLKKDIVTKFPSIPIKQFMKLCNVSQSATYDQIKMALSLSQAPPHEKQSFLAYLKDPELLVEKPVRCQELIEKLNPGYDFLVMIGINTVRPYTLASWDPEQKFLDLVVSITPDGLTSQYFQSIPKFIRLYPIDSAFYIPQNKPILMIANGSGIAPFRSIVQYFIRTKPDKFPKLYLYYGIQHRECDFYFREEWQKYEKEGLIKLRIAQSRRDPDNKQYIQSLIRQDKEFVKSHLFEDNGVIFICGGSNMAKSVDGEIFQAIKLKEKIPFQAFKLSKKLLADKVIVKEVFH